MTRLLNEDAKIIAVYPGDSVIEVTHDIVGLLEAVREAKQLEELTPAIAD